MIRQSFWIEFGKKKHVSDSYVLSDKKHGLDLITY